MNRNLGCKARDKITGFAGVITAYVEYLTGCHQYLLAPPCQADGALVDPSWLDVDRLEIYHDTQIKLSAETAGPARPGFDREAPKR